jgi:hypothetical protein
MCQYVLFTAVEPMGRDALVFFCVNVICCVFFNEQQLPVAIPSEPKAMDVHELRPTW